MTVFFLVVLLVERCIKSQGRKQEGASEAYEFLLLLLATTVKCDEASLGVTLTDLLFATPFQENGNTMFPVSHLLPSRDYEPYLRSIGIHLEPSEVCHVKNPRLCVQSYYMFKMLVQKGMLPLESLCALAAFVEDGIYQGRAIHDYDETAISGGKARVKTTRADKACAWARYLSKPTEGLTKHLARPKQKPRQSFFKRGNTEDSLSTGEHEASKTDVWVRESQMCPTEKGAAAGTKLYRHVYEEGVSLV